MPDHLVRRIEARLEVEQAHRSSGDHPLGRQADRVADLAAERTRRRPGRTLALLGAAAAGLVVTTVTLTQVLGDAGADSSGTAAQYPSRDGADEAGPEQAGAGGAEGAQDDAAEEEAAADAAGAAGSAEDAAAETSVTQLEILEEGGVVVLPDLGRVGADDYGQLILAASGDAGDDDQAAADGPTALTAGEAEACWAGLSTSDWSQRYASPADYLDGGGVEDVVVLLGLREDRTGRSWVVPASCTATPGVTPLDPEGLLVQAP